MDSPEEVTASALPEVSALPRLRRASTTRTARKIPTAARIASPARRRSRRSDRLRRAFRFCCSVIRISFPSARGGDAREETGRFRGPFPPRGVS